MLAVYELPAVTLVGAVTNRLVAGACATLTVALPAVVLEPLALVSVQVSEIDRGAFGALTVKLTELVLPSADNVPDALLSAVEPPVSASVHAYLIPARAGTEAL